MINIERGAITMPIKVGVYFEPDELDNEMSRNGYLNEVEAGEQLGMPLTALRSMANSGDITLEVVKGRRYFTAKSVISYIKRFGYPSAEQRRLAYIESLPNERGLCGMLGQERLEILQRMQDRVNAQSRAMGGGPPQSESTVSRELPTDPGESFIRKFGGAQCQDHLC
jgi:hypothetical protein